LGLWPTAVPFETAEGAASHVLGDIVDGPAAALTAVALVAGDAAAASGWAVDAALAVARQWPGERRAVLVDAVAEARPDRSVAAVAGVPDEDGLADVAEYGLSLQSVLRRRGSYDVVTPGVYVPDPAMLRDEHLWDRLLAEAGPGRLTLLVLLPAGEPGVADLVRRLGAVLVLAEPGEEEPVVDSLPSAYSVLAVLVPPGAADEADEVTPDTAPESSEEPPPDDEPLVLAAAADEMLHGPGPPDPPQAGEPSRLSDEEFERIKLPTDRAARDALIAELRDRQRAARMAPSHGGAEQVAAADSRAGPPENVTDGAEGLSNSHVARYGIAAGDVAAAANRADSDVRGMPRILVPAGESDHAREMRLEAEADDVTLESLDPGAGEGAGWGPQPRRQRLRRGLGWTLAVVLAVSMLAGSWRFLSGRLGSRAGPATTPAAADTAALPAADDAATRDIGLPFVVAVEAHTDLATALGRLDALGSEQGIAFHIAPLEREGRLYYHLMAGPAPDSTAALALRDTLLARRIKTAATPTDVRHAPFAFLIGDYSDRPSAEQSVSELRRLDIPSYTLSADAADGQPLFRVYVGGFATPAEADVTRQVLRAAGVQDSLVTRTGIITP
jgi:hypothetical protein